MKREYKEIPYTCIGCKHYLINTCLYYDLKVNENMIACKEHFAGKASYLVDYEKKLNEIYKKREKRRKSKYKNK